jgi:hypothetical protein
VSHTASAAVHAGHAWCRPCTYPDPHSLARLAQNVPILLVGLCSVQSWVYDSSALQHRLLLAQLERLAKQALQRQQLL